MLVFAGILLLTVPPTHRPFRQAAEVTGAAFLGAGFAILLAVTTYDQPWLYLPLQCAALTVLLVLSRVTAARAAFILAALVLSFAEPAYLPDPEGAIRRRAVQCARPRRYGLGGRSGHSSVRPAGDPRSRRPRLPGEENWSALRCSR